jgi:hypothetical protein
VSAWHTSGKGTGALDAGVLTTANLLVDGIAGLKSAKCSREANPGFALNAIVSPVINERTWIRDTRINTTQTSLKI